MRLRGRWLFIVERASGGGSAGDDAADSRLTLVAPAQPDFVDCSLVNKVVLLLDAFCVYVQ